MSRGQVRQLKGAHMKGLFHMFSCCPRMPDDSTADYSYIMFHAVPGQLDQGHAGPSGALVLACLAVQDA